jgi:hypothetical protein
VSNTASFTCCEARAAGGRAPSAAVPLAALRYASPNAANGYIHAKEGGQANGTAPHTSRASLKFVEVYVQPNVEN